VLFLNPFDNLLIQRQRLQHWFGLDYQIEVYVPAAKRKFGYYSLPVFFGHVAAGLMDVKAQRQLRQLDLQHLHIARQWLVQRQFSQQFATALQAYAAFNGCDTVVLKRAEPAVLRWFNEEISPQLNAVG
jgi:uncharacterized protein YcaQ